MDKVCTVTMTLLQRLNCKCQLDNCCKIAFLIDLGTFLEGKDRNGYNLEVKSIRIPLNPTLLITNLVSNAPYYQRKGGL